MALNSNGKAAQAVPPDADFDVYQVGYALARIIRELPRPIENVLIVGPSLPLKDAAFPGIEIAEHFLSPSKFSSDTASCPFSPNEFSCVVIFDTLQTVRHELHRSLIEQYAEVAREYVVVISPFDSPIIRNAHESVDDLVRKTLSGGEANAAPSPRRQYPDLHSVTDWLTASFGERPLVLPLGSVRSWSLLRMLEHAVTAVDQGQSFYRNLSRFYNKRLSGADNARPNYRNLLLCSRAPFSPEIAESFRSMFSPGGREAEVQVMFDLIKMAMDAMASTQRPKRAAQPLQEMQQRLEELERKNRTQARQIEKLTAQLEDTKNSGISKSRTGLLGKLFSHERT